MVLAIGVVLVAAGLTLLFNVAGAGDFVVRRVTSRSLGELAPGFAAKPLGFKTYAVLVLAIGVFATGLGVVGWTLPVGATILVLGAITFVIASVFAIVGEVQTYRALKR
ncbi:MAG TPA: hypothetical protein VGU71_19635 [Candidatus Dormibacteraeota bacterium]|nr:hypothetical protein [Candidatus Dormibacteraeota bacterium]